MTKHQSPNASRPKQPFLIQRCILHLLVCHARIYFFVIFSQIINFPAWKIDDSFETNKLIETNIKLFFFGTNIFIWSLPGRKKKVFVCHRFLIACFAQSIFCNVPFYVLFSASLNVIEFTYAWFSTLLLKNFWKFTHFRIVYYRLQISGCSKSSPGSIDAVLWPRTVTRCCTSEQIRDELRTTTVWWNGFPGCSGTWGWWPSSSQSCLHLTPSQTLT